MFDFEEQCFSHTAFNFKLDLCFFLSLVVFYVQVNLCLLQASVEEGSPSCSSKSVTHVSLVALCFDRIATQFRMNR